MAWADLGRRALCAPELRADCGEMFVSPCPLSIPPSFFVKKKRGALKPLNRRVCYPHENLNARLFFFLCRASVWLMVPGTLPNFIVFTIFVSMRRNGQEHICRAGPGRV
jgi:hypothetical protein